jgi:hypothetical protein
LVVLQLVQIRPHDTLLGIVWQPDVHGGEGLRETIGVSLIIVCLLST